MIEPIPDEGYEMPYAQGVQVQLSLTNAKIDELRQSIALLNSMIGERDDLIAQRWLPIATAPKDGTWILVYDANLQFYVYEWQKQRSPYRIVFWDDFMSCWQGDRRISDTAQLTHWQPLPLSPKDVTP